ncbi:MarR family winged helix-turn-helix transcriptional regulator [Luteipulveratus mongoliensis]|uniref:HTH marR-type domain-containing protein n=1 Tax=Luteipulveratus mongoliensis TaxID=571913 RepID=A0A0K1JH27_9MICO|nr:MarR family winged helix-turn-helix transcriptional regulator [Luteipulveratus mongoliensis]AKU16022.1 hypothetical protein VV02_09410 [Luteipulveratus mongoliensis]
MADDGHPALAEMLCFDLYAASRAVTAVYRPLLAEIGLTYPQYLVLVVLWREKECTVKELSGALQLDYGTLTPLLRRMEKSALITRRRRDDDERSVTISLTEAGAALRSHERPVQARIAKATGLAVTEVAELQRTLRALTASAADAGS